MCCVILRCSPENVDVAWYLDTNASDHMTGDEATFIKVDKGTFSTIKLRDDSLMAIQGCDTVLFTTAG